MNFKKFQIGAKTVGKGTKGEHTIPPAGRALEHNTRTDPDRARGNDKIDPERTHLNYDLAEELRERLHNGKTATEIYNERLEGAQEKYKGIHGKKMKKDSVTMCSVVVTAPKDLPEDKHKEFFEESYAYLIERYGEENVLAANVHMDESQPHMHFQFMPFVQDKENGGQKLCARDLETPKSLRTLHPQLQKRLTEKLGCPVHLLNGTTVGGNKTKLELEVQSLREALHTLTDTGFVQKAIDKITKGKKLTDEEIAVVQATITAMNTAEQSLQREIEEATKHKQRYDKKANALDDESDNIKAKLTNAMETGRTAERNRLTIQLNDKNKQIATLTEERDKLLQQVQEQAKDIKTLKKQLHEQKKQKTTPTLD